MNDIAWNLRDIKSPGKNAPKVMTTFSCGGGSSMGYKLAGCDVIAANDIDPEMEWHYVKNLKPKLFFRCPIASLLVDDLPKSLFDLDILDGSPPCSTFSLSGNREEDWGRTKKFREGQSEQVLSNLFFDYIKLAIRLKPKVIVAENVKGLVIGSAVGFAKTILSELSKAGYSTQIFILNSADFGVPQTRERVFFCGLRSDIGKEKLKLEPKEAWVSAGSAVRDLVPTEDELNDAKLDALTDKKWWPKTFRGETYAKAVVRNGGDAKLWNHVKLDDRKPAATLTGIDMAKHWAERRKLTFREWKRLGSFPDDYFARSEKIGKYIIGMSVPPFVTKYIAEQIRKQWLQ